MSNQNPSPETRFQEGNTVGRQFSEGNRAAVKHGGESAILAIREGKPFKGLAAQAERDVQADLASSGRGGLVREIAVRAHTAMRLYWSAVQQAADDGDLAALDSYCARFGWLAGVASRAWREVREEEKQTGDPGGVLDAALVAVRGENVQD